MLDPQKVMRGARVSLLTTTALLTTFVAGTGSLRAQISIPDGANIPTVSPPPVVAGTVWNLQGDATIFSPAVTPSTYYQVSLPTGATGLTINGAAGGSTVTLNDGSGHFGYMASHSATTVTISNVTFTGGHNNDFPIGGTGAGGIIYNEGNLTVNTSGAVTFANSLTDYTIDISIGGALYSNNRLTINDSGNLAITGNTALGFGGGVYALHGIVINNTGQPAITVTNNVSLGRGGGGLNDGDGLTITGGANISQNTVLQDGGGVRSVGGTVSIGTASGDVTVSGNSASTGAPTYDGGGIVSYSVGVGDGNVTLGNSAGTVTITGNTAGYTTATSGVVANLGANAGGIFADGATSITGATIALSNNRATGDGGGIYSGGAVTLTGNQVTVTSNNALGFGGAIFAGGNVTIGAFGSTDLVTGNTAPAGGGAIYSNAGTVTINGTVTLSSNTATNGSGGAIQAAGGSVAVNGNLTAMNDIAGLSGGAVSASGSVTALGDANLTSNTAETGSGGAIFAGGDVTIGATDSTVTLSANAAAVEGGAIFAGGGVTIGKATVTATLSGNTAPAGGGAIYSNAGAVIINGTATLSSNTATSGNGGAIEAAGGGVTVNGNLTAMNDMAGLSGGAVFASGSVMVVGDANLTSNIAATGSGGAIFAGGDVTIGSTGSTVTLSANAAAVEGGAIFAGGGVTIGNATSTVMLADNIAPAGGGAIYSLAGTVTINGTVTLSSNTATSGSGGAIQSAGGGVTVNGNLTAMNDIAGLSGGAVSANGPVTVVGNANLTSNTAATGSGGAIFAGGDATIGSTGSTVTLTGNAAAVEGGAIFASGDVAIGNADSTDTITGNTAGLNGGAIASAGATTLTGSAITLSDNTATADGGGIYSAQAVTVTGPLTANSNTATNGNGGAIDAQAGGVTVTGSLTASGNIAGLSGGAVYALAGDVTATTDVSMDHNRATGGNGGAIDAVAGAVNLATASGSVSLTNNIAGGSGGSINAGGDVTLGNDAGTLTLTGDTAGLNGGAIASGGATTLVGNTIMLTGNTAAGAGGAVFAAGDFTLASGSDTAISGNSAGTLGGALWIGGDANFSATAGDITFSGNTESTSGTPRANAIYLDNTGGATTTTFDATPGHSITFFDPIQSNAANGLVSVMATGGGMVAFDGSLYSNLIDRWSQVYGNTEVQSGTTFVVRNNAVYGALAADVGGAAGGSSFTVDSDATLAGGIVGEVRADNFALNGTLNIAGAAPPGNASGGFSMFTVTSNNVSFGAGSVVLFNTYLNDASVQRTDLLTLNLNGSATSGTAAVAVTNVGGPGGLTVGNGIELVHVTNNNGTTAGAFTLAHEVRGGIFDYRLFRGGVDGSDPNDWFLRTIGPGGPIIGPELATYSVVQPLAQQLGRAMLGTHDERFGDLYRVQCEPAETNAPPYTKAPVYTKAPTADCGAYGWRPAVWGRLFGQQIDNHYQAFIDPSASGQIAGFQAGADFLRSDSLIAGHTDYAGLYAAYGNANADVSGFVTNAAATALVLQHTGHVNLNAYSGGAYWTHYGPQGWYLDLTLQGTSYGGAASTEFARLNTNGSGFVSSLESGYPIALPQLGFGFVLEPQAQVLWQWVSFDAGNDGLGPVALGTTSETTARVGVKGKWTITTDSGQVWQPYVRANFWSDFGGTAATLFGPDSVPLISHGQYMDVDAGFTTKIDTHLSAFVDAGYQFAVSHDGGGRRDGVRGTAGLRYQW